MYGSVRTVVWQGSVGDHRPYADQTAYSEVIRRERRDEDWPPENLLVKW